MNATKKLILAGLCLALGVALPVAFHSIPDAGMFLLPMHIPVLLCGLICGWPYGLICGLLTPVLSFLLTSMPPVVILPGMVSELMVYGLTTGLLMRHIKTRRRAFRLYLSLLGAMLCGRVVSGLLNALIFRAGNYSIQIWVGASFVTALPGIAIQILLIPIIVIALRKLKLID